MAETSEYAITIEAHAPDGDQFDPDAYADELMDAAAGYDGIVTVAPSSWRITFTIEAHDASAAVTSAWQLAEKFDVGPYWPIVAFDVVRADVLDQRNAAPNAPDLVSGTEAAAILDVSRQRLHQLAHSHPDFPRPLYQLGAGSLWTRQAVERFAEVWNRRPGRPPGRTGIARAG